MSSREPAQFAGGTSETQNPADWIRKLRLYVRTIHSAATDPVKKEIMRELFKVGSPADIWLDSITDTCTWDELIAKFNGRFPQTNAAERTPAEAEGELMATKLLESKLGQKETMGGAEIYSHIAFARRLLELAIEAEVVDKTTYIAPVRKALPSIIKSALDSTYTNWREFTTAIQNIPIDRINDGVDEQKKRDKKIDELTAQLRSASIAQAPSPTRTQTYQSAPVVRSTYQPTPVLRTQYQPRPPQANAVDYVPSAKEITDMEIRISRMPHQPNTPAGKAAYADDLARWLLFNPSNHVSQESGYPLAPGTLQVGTGDCWSCGMATIPRHDARSCTATVKVHPKERIWRRLAFNVLKHRPRAEQVNAVHLAGNWYDAYTPSSPDESGNGDGLSE
jgi:hypothetical protein